MCFLPSDQMTATHPTYRTRFEKDPNELNHRRAERDDVERRKQKEHEREHELDADLGGALLRALAALLREVAAWVRSACAMLVPKRSVCTSMATSARTSSTRVRAAKFLKASIRGLPARISVVIMLQFGSERRMGDLQLVAGFQDGLVEPAAGLDADDHQVQRVRQAVFDPPLVLGDQMADGPAPGSCSRDDPPTIAPVQATGPLISAKPQRRTAPAVPARRRIDDRRLVAVNAAAARRRRSRPISFGDFGSVRAIALEPRIELFRRGSIRSTERPRVLRLGARAISRRRRRSGEVRASTAEAPSPVISGDRNETAATIGIQSSGVMFPRLQ